MGRKAGVVNVFAMEYKVWPEHETTTKVALNLFKNKDLPMEETLQKEEKLIEIVSTHIEAATHILRQRTDNALEAHTERALDASDEYRALRESMPRDMPKALESYQSEYSEHEWAMADMAIKTYGVELAVGQFLFHGGHWASNSPTITTSRPFSTSFCPQVALRNAEWKGKAYDADRVDLMVVCVTQPKTKAYVYSRESHHGNEKEVVFASGAQLTRVRETHITDIPVLKATSGIQMEEKIVPAYLVEVEIS